MNTSMISVIIPCYNVAEFIEKCISSIFNNDFHELEIILINDGSTDSTFEILKNIKDKYCTENILLINQENKGLSESRNIGIDLATGDFIMFIDSDDWVSPNYFTQFFDRSVGAVDLVLASYVREFEKKSIPRILNLKGRKEAKDIKRRVIGLTSEELYDPSQADSIVTAWSKLYCTKIILENNIRFISTKLIGTEDLLFNIYYLQYCNTVYIIDKPLYHYRKDNNTSLTHKYKKNLFVNWQNLYSKIEATIKPEELKIREAFANRVCLSIIGLGLNEIRNPKGIRTINKNLKFYLSTPRYKRSFEVLNFKYFPIHWKVFFLFAKYQMTIPLYVMLKVISKIIKN